MRINRLKQLLQKGQKVFGTFVSLPEPGIIEAIGAAGYDFVIIDMEHSPIDFSDLRYLLSAADRSDLIPLVRVSSKEANSILRVLDIGASGVVAPHIKSKEDALSFVKSCYYPPKGVRGISSSSRAAEYGKIEISEHTRVSNQEILTVAIIEDKQALESIEDIVDTEDLDVIFPGPGDLSASMGMPGNVQHPMVKEGVDRIAKVVRSDPGKSLGYLIMEPSQIARCQEIGARLIVFSQDTKLIFQSYRDALKEVRRFIERLE